MESKLAKNVLMFADECSEKVGEFSKYDWLVDLHSECEDLQLESPIEQILYCALRTTIKLNYIQPAEPYFNEKEGNYVVGCNIIPQHKFGNYRVDFLIGNYKYDCKNKIQFSKEVIIECDSQEFHDRSETERRYEKRRDRFLQSKGFKIFHYTGTEIIANPFKIAKEIIAFVTEQEEDDLSTH